MVAGGDEAQFTHFNRIVQSETTDMTLASSQIQVVSSKACTISLVLKMLKFIVESSRLVSSLVESSRLVVEMLDS